MKKISKLLLCSLFLFLFVLVSNTDMANAKTSKKNSADYMTLSYGNVDRVELISSLDDFENRIEMSAYPLFTPQYNYFDQDFSVQFNEPGYLIFRASGYFSSAYVKAYRDSSKTAIVKDVTVGVDVKYGYMPVESGTYYFSLNDLKSFYLGFVPASEKCTIKATKQKNGSVYLNITSLDKKAKITAVAVDGVKSAASCFNDSWLVGDYDSTNTDKVASILLPEAGEYTVMVETEYADCHNRFVYHINTKDLTGNSSKLETPISILAGTNVIVGTAEPGSMVYAKYNGVDYSTKADSDGVYRLKVTKLKKKKTVEMWQTENGKKTAEGKFKVVNKY